MRFGFSYCSLKQSLCSVEKACLIATMSSYDLCLKYFDHKVYISHPIMPGIMLPALINLLC